MTGHGQSRNRSGGLLHQLLPADRASRSGKAGRKTGRLFGIGAAMLVVMALTLNSSLAVEPGEVLEDPALEERARDISRNLRCLVCQNETIDESNAPLAGDLRILVRQLLASGKDDQEVLDHVVSRYGEYVLFKPLRQGANWILYLAGPAAFMLALLLAIAYIGPRRRQAGSRADKLDPEEQELLGRLLIDADDGEDRQI